MPFIRKPKSDPNGFVEMMSPAIEFPIVFIHAGNSDYLKYSLAQAKHSNPASPVCLIGDDSNDLYEFVEHYQIVEYREGAEAFAKYYHHLNTNDYLFECFCFARWFILRDFMRSQGIDRLLYLDSDVLLYANVLDESKRFSHADITLSHGMSPHCVYISSLQGLSALCDFMMNCYVDPSYRYVMLGAFKNVIGVGTPGGASDMAIMAEYGRINPSRVAELTIMNETSIYDHNVKVSDGFEMTGGEESIKRLFWREGFPCGTRQSDQRQIRFNALHFQGPAKSLMQDYSQVTLERNFVTNKFNLLSNAPAVSNDLPVHFITIVLNGEPFIRYHFNEFEKLPFRWHWHIVEGVADLQHDTAWSLKNGGHIPEEMHRSGISNDGTKEYLDTLARYHPDRVTLYRKQGGAFWSGKQEMISAPLAKIREECLLWQVDVDELWTSGQLIAARKMFVMHPDRTAAYYYCTLFVGRDRIVTTRNTFGNMTEYEWLRTWRFRPGDSWRTHEPPCLCRMDHAGKAVDVASINPFTHEETDRHGLVFQHHAFAVERQVRYKEKYYAYHGLVDCWHRLESATNLPVRLGDYFRLNDYGAMVDTAASQGIVPLTRKLFASLDGAAALLPQHHATSARRCWCGGVLEAFSHPAYRRCLECGTLVAVEAIPSETLKEFYSQAHYWNEYQKQVGNYPDIRQRSYSDFNDRIPAWYSILIRYMPSFDSILELGCAHGGFLHYCRERGAQRAVGVEVDEATCAFARERFGLTDVYSGLFPDVELPFERFDVVCGFDVIEHFSDPVRGMSKMASLLNDDGILFVQTPCYQEEGSEWHHMKPDEHLYLFGEASIRRLFAVSGLEIVDIIPGYFAGDCCVVARKLQRKRILYVRTDTIGDNVLSMSILPYLREQYRDAIIHVLCQEHIAELYETCPHTDGVIPFDFMRAYKGETYRNLVLDKICDFRPDLVLNSLYSRELLNEFLVLGSSGGQIVGMHGEVWDFTTLREDIREQNDACYSWLIPSSGTRKAEIERYRDFLCGLGITPAEMPSVVWTTPEDEAFAEEFFAIHMLDTATTVALFPAGRHGGKLYPRYAEALNDICRDQGVTILVMGSDADREVACRIIDQLTVRSVSCVGEITLRQLAAILRRCRLAVGADTGTAHIACAVGTPNVVILWGGHFGRFFPYSALTSVVCLPLACYGCNWKCPYEQWHCVAGIEPQVVSRAVAESLHTFSAKPRMYAQTREAWHPTPGQPQWEMFERYVDYRQVTIIPVE